MRKILGMILVLMVLAAFLNVSTQQAFDASHYPVSQTKAWRSFNAAELGSHYEYMKSVGGGSMFKVAQVLNFGFLLTTAGAFFLLLVALNARLKVTPWRSPLRFGMIAVVMAVLFGSLEILMSLAFSDEPQLITQTVAVVYCLTAWGSVIFLAFAGLCFVLGLYGFFQKISVSIPRR